MKKRLSCMILSLVLVLSLAVPAAFAANGDTYDAAKAYRGGDTVIYNGVEYTAKWYTQGEIPGEGFSAWERTRLTDADLK
ncbi:MAG: hypothetical protein HUJ80_08650, partial [Firmicutes bacterium]|nr:hypothetical protein [Bacillota bacterium]